MKLARVMIEAISISCPHCDEWVANRTNYAFLHDGTNRDELVNEPVRRCENCQQTFRLPKIVEKLGVPQ